MLILGKTKLY